MARRNTFRAAQICGITVIATLIFCIIVAVGPRLAMMAGGFAGDLRDVDVMAMDD
ncbi:MAG: hypothetical protein JO000_16630 [Alphaproteobacteria bacterium]|nr:hypothetical protein [Alphaproteobacteria bacterium]